MLQPAPIDPALYPADNDKQPSEHQNAADDVHRHQLDVADGAAKHYQFDEPVERRAGFIPDVDQVDDKSNPDDKICNELHEAYACSRGTFGHAEA